MRYLILFLFLIFQSVSFGQDLKGKVYDSKFVVKDMKVLNKTQNRLTVTDMEGNFSIVAKVNDTISFESIFYHPLEVIINQSHFNQDNVFEVKKVTNELDEIEVISDPENRFDSIAFYTTIEAEKVKLSEKPLIQSGENLRPTLYLKQLFKSIGKLFGKKKSKTTSQLPLDYQQLETFFSKHSFFNKTLIIKDLKIPEDKVKLFIDFCASKGLSPNLLLKENKMELLEALVVNSELFLILLDTYGKEEDIKD